MKRLFLTAAIIITGSLNLMSQDSKSTRNIKGDFNRIEIGYHFEATIEQASGNSAEIEFSSELEPYIIAKVSGGTLYLTLDDQKMRNIKKRRDFERMKAYTTLKAHIKVRELTEVECNGTSSLSFSGKFKGKELELELNGVSKVNGESLDFGNIEISASGVSECRIMNLTTDNCEIDISGGSKVKVKGQSRSVDAELSGSSNISIEDTSIADKINLSLSGASAAELSGKCKVLNAELSGASACDAIKLLAENAYIKGSGASKISVDAKMISGVDISGASRLNITEETVMSSSVSISGAASIKTIKK